MSGASVTQHALRLVDTSVSGSKILIERVEERKFPDPLFFTPSSETISDSLETVFLHLSSIADSNTQPISITLPVSMFLMQQLYTPLQLLHSERLHEFRWELSLLYPDENFGEMILQSFPLESGAEKHPPETLLIGIRKDVMMALMQVAESRQFRLQSVDHPAIALYKYAAQRFRHLNGYALAAFLDSGFLTVIITHKGALSAAQVFQLKPHDLILKTILDFITATERKWGKEISFEEAYISEQYESGAELQKKLKCPVRDLNAIVRIASSDYLFRSKEQEDLLSGSLLALGSAMPLP